MHCEASDDKVYHNSKLDNAIENFDQKYEIGSSNAKAADEQTWAQEGESESTLFHQFEGCMQNERCVLTRDVIISKVFPRLMILTSCEYQLGMDCDKKWRVQLRLEPRVRHAMHACTNRLLKRIISITIVVGIRATLGPSSHNGGQAIYLPSGVGRI